MRDNLALSSRLQAAAGAAPAPGPASGSLVTTPPYNGSRAVTRVSSLGGASRSGGVGAALAAASVQRGPLSAGSASTAAAAALQAELSQQVCSAAGDGKHEVEAALKAVGSAQFELAVQSLNAQR